MEIVTYLDLWHKFFYFSQHLSKSASYDSAISTTANPLFTCSSIPNSHSHPATQSTNLAEKKTRAMTRGYSHYHRLLENMFFGVAVVLGWVQRRCYCSWCNVVTPLVSGGELSYIGLERVWDGGEFVSFLGLGAGQSWRIRLCSRFFLTARSSVIGRSGSGYWTRR